MTDNLTYISTGFILGLSGLIPGPLLTLVITETLKQGVKDGIKIAVSPLFTDLPIILITILIISRFSNTNFILGFIAFGGSIYLLYLAYESFSFRGNDTSTAILQENIIKKGIIANFLNPSPYVFWLTIGAPTVLKAYNISIITASFFIIVFYSVLVGSKVVIAMITGKTKNFLNNRYYSSIHLHYLLQNHLQKTPTYQLFYQNQLHHKH